MSVQTCKRKVVEVTATGAVIFISRNALASVLPSATEADAHRLIVIFEEHTKTTDRYRGYMAPPTGARLNSDRLAYCNDLQTAAAVFAANPELANDPDALGNAAGHEGFLRLMLHYITLRNPVTVKMRQFSLRMAQT